MKKIINLANDLLALVGVRRRIHYWGTVYDSKTKQPLDPVMVRLVDAESGIVAETCITDINGRYGFLGWPGKFKILAKKTNYIFPSVKIFGDKDGVYENLYRGEFFEISGGTEVISFNIPMDPAGADWNQQAKKSIVDFSPFLEDFLYRMVSIVFWFVLVMSVLGLIFAPSPFVYGLLSFYGLVFLLAMITPKPRLWGRVVGGKNKSAVRDALVELSHSNIPDLVVAKARTFQDGKFFLRAPKGKYIMNIIMLDQEASKKITLPYQVSIGRRGVVTEEIRLPD